MSEEQNLTGLIRDAVDQGATSAEEIHKAIAALPLNVLEKIEGFEESAQEIKKIEDQSIGAVYDLIRRINHAVAETAETILAAPGRSREG